jgi:hypothetical protein
MYSITTAHCENPAFAKLWAETPALADLIVESLSGFEMAIAEGFAVTEESLRTFYRDFYLIGINHRPVGELSTLLGRLDTEVCRFVHAVETDMMHKGAHIDLYPLRKAMNWYKESYYSAYWMTLNQDAVNAMDFLHSSEGEARHYFVDNLFVVARLLGRFEVITELLSVADIEFKAFQPTYCRNAEFDLALEKNWLTHLVGVGIEQKGLTDASRSIWAHSVCDVIERTAGDGRDLEHVASRLMFEVLESFREEERGQACESMKLGFASQWQAGYVNEELFTWCDFEHYFGMSASEAALQIHAGALSMDWKQRFLVSLLEETPDRKSVTHHRSGRPQEFQIIGFADDMKRGGRGLELAFYDFIEKSFAVIADEYEIGTSLLVNDFSDRSLPRTRNAREISDLVGAYHHCLRHLFNLKNDQATHSQVNESVAVLKDKMTRFGAVARSFFTLGTLLGQNEETLAIFEQLVDHYSVSPAFLHELSGLDKELMCKNIKFAAAIFSKDLGL